MYSGAGNKYWKEFDENIQENIVSSSQTINKLLFEPQYDKPIKTLDLPMCGKNQSNLSFIYDMVTFVSEGENVEDRDGQKTLKTLNSIKRLFRKNFIKRTWIPRVASYNIFLFKKGEF